MPYTSRVVDAMALMFQLHETQLRKGNAVPYITHLLAVAAIVGEYGGDEEQFIAALLHDAVEDQGGQETLARIREQFGERVAEMVWACSDTDVLPKPPWRARKESYIAAVAHEPPAVKLISAADKLHNIRTTIMDLRIHGTVIWDRFQGGMDGSLWYYREVFNALAHDWSHPVLEDLEDAVANLAHAAHEAAKADGLTRQHDHAPEQASATPKEFPRVE